MDGKRDRVAIMTTESGDKVEKQREVTTNGNYAENVGGHYIQNNGTIYLGNQKQSKSQSEETKSSNSSGDAKGGKLCVTLHGEFNELDENAIKSIIEILKKKSIDPNLFLVAIIKGSIKLIRGSYRIRVKTCKIAIKCKPVIHLNYSKSRGMEIAPSKGNGIDCKSITKSP
jgi:uncharacterized protein YjcR